MTEQHHGIRNAVKWSVASNICNQGITGVLTFVLASLLTPGDFGVVALAYIYISFIATILGFGFEVALVQRSEINDIHLSSVFWLNFVTSIIFAGCAIAVSKYYGSFHATENVLSIITVLSLIIPMQGLSLVQISLLERNMDFRSLGIRKNVAVFLGGLTGITLAVNKAGAWALVGQHLMIEFVSLIMLWRASRWLPSLSFKIEAIRDLSSFAFKTLLGRLGTFTQMNTDSLLIGLLVGTNALGIYRFSTRIVEMVLSIITRAMQSVALSYFSRYQNSTDELNKRVLIGSQINNLCVVPIYGLIAVMAPNIITVIGVQWHDAIPVLKILCVLGASRAMLIFLGPLFQASGKPEWHSLNMWILAILNSIAVVVVVLLFQTEAQGSQITLVALARTVVYLAIMAPFMLVLANRTCGLNIKKFLFTGRNSTIIAIIIWITLEMIRVILPENTSLLYFNELVLALSLSIATVCWILSIYCLEHDIFTSGLNILKSYLKRLSNYTKKQV